MSFGQNGYFFFPFWVNSLEIHLLLGKHSFSSKSLSTYLHLLDLSGKKEVEGCKKTTGLVENVLEWKKTHGTTAHHIVLSYFNSF